MITNRVIIYTKDIQRLTGKSEQCSRKLLRKIKILKAKAKHQYVDIHDFSDYSGIAIDLIRQQLVD